MSSLYIHIPFCKQACYYCDFHFSTNKQLEQSMTQSICDEIKLQKNYLSEKKLRTLYFGGGTPSLLQIQNLDQIFDTVYKIFDTDPSIEITLEANPDDLNPVKLDEFKNLGINRLSIGIQSFQPQALAYLHRAHNVSQAYRSVSMAQQAGFENISIDVMYGLPGLTVEAWEKELQQVLSLQVPHISVYQLTIEPRTVFGKWLTQKKINPIEEDTLAEQFEFLINFLEAEGYDHYEISNFAKPGCYSRHNSNYWSGNEYLGIGPSAHSFNGHVRQHNISNNTQYIKALQSGVIPAEYEELTWQNQVNEYLLTGLRTMEGCSLEKLENLHPNGFFKNNQKTLENFQEKNWVSFENGHLKLTKKGKLLADSIAADLFIV